MKLVYVAGPFRGPTAWDIEQNIRRAEVAGMEVAQLGAAPLIPHANTRFFHGTLTDEFWLRATMAMLDRCDAVQLVPGWPDSKGTLAEIERAKERGIPVFAVGDDLESWLEKTSNEPSPNELCDIDDLPDCLIGGVHQPHCRHAGKPVLSVAPAEPHEMLDWPVTVCAACLQASCWHGEFMCDASPSANVTVKMASELRALDREHPDHYSPAKIKKVHGCFPSVRRPL